MVPVTSLWLPVVLSAVIVFIASSVIHMVLGYHKNDLLAVPKEDEVMAALRPFNLPPGDYAIPKPASMKEMGSPAFLDKLKRGPVVLMNVGTPGPPTMNKALVNWFIYILVISVFSAYVGSRAVTSSADYLSVFRFVGTTAFMGYAMALPQFSIWYRRNWGTTLLSMFDGLLYACLTAGTFGWLWPR
ncbi:MAG TPA: hypothetical protein VLT86_11430 [Vicinamibacterales bacterium]|nr:hypothetical protein [Vicinamibacterales bacterium]